MPVCCSCRTRMEAARFLGVVEVKLSKHFDYCFYVASDKSGAVAVVATLFRNFEDYCVIFGREVLRWPCHDRSYKLELRLEVEAAAVFGPLAGVRSSVMHAGRVWAAEMTRNATRCSKCHSARPFVHTLGHAESYPRSGLARRRRPLGCDSCSGHNRRQRPLVIRLLPLSRGRHLSIQGHKRNWPESDHQTTFASRTSNRLSAAMYFTLGDQLHLQ